MDKQNMGITEKIQDGIRQAAQGIFESSEDIVSVIKEDHKPLKELISVMKNADLPFDQRMSAFEEFAPLLLTHAKAEEKSLYVFMKSQAELKDYGLEGDTEHGIADQLVEEIKRVADEDMAGAKIKVLAELVEHHIQEEESDILPDVKAKVSADILVKLTDKYTAVQAEIISQGQEDSPSESELKETALRH